MDRRLRGDPMLDVRFGHDLGLGLKAVQEVGGDALPGERNANWPQKRPLHTRCFGRLYMLSFDMFGVFGLQNRPINRPKSRQE
jgi:hypothetical protein